MLFKDIFIKKLHQLPEDILQKVYYLDIVILRGRLQWDSFLADKYREYETVISNPVFLEFKINDWYIKMEKEHEIL